MSKEHFSINLYDEKNQTCPRYGPSCFPSPETLKYESQYLLRIQCKRIANAIVQRNVQNNHRFDRYDKQNSSDGPEAVATWKQICISSLTLRWFRTELNGRWDFRQFQRTYERITNGTSSSVLNDNVSSVLQVCYNSITSYVQNPPHTLTPPRW